MLTLKKQLKNSTSDRGLFRNESGTRLKTLLIAGLASAIFATDQANADTALPTNGDQYRVVDCLLPGQVRQLGSRMTYMGRRRPARLTAEQCQIRGGEFVMEDRASVSGSIKVWLPIAMEGDPEAEYFMGQLFETGENGNPDYAMARSWYERSANRGYSEAQFALARLYDQGLGGAADEAKAKHWYAEAYGIDGTLTDAVRLVDREELEQLQQTVVSQRETISEQSAEISRLQGEVSELEIKFANLDESRRRSMAQVALYQRQLAEARNELASAIQPASTDMAAIEEAYRALEVEREALRIRQQTLSQLEAEQAARTAELSNQINALQSEAELGTVQQAALRDLQSELDAANVELASLKSGLAEAEEFARQGTGRSRTTSPGPGKTHAGPAGSRKRAG